MGLIDNSSVTLRRKSDGLIFDLTPYVTSLNITIGRNQSMSWTMTLTDPEGVLSPEKAATANLLRPRFTSQGGSSSFVTDPTQQVLILSTFVGQGFPLVDLVKDGVILNTLISVPDSSPYPFATVSTFLQNNPATTVSQLVGKGIQVLNVGQVNPSYPFNATPGLSSTNVLDKYIQFELYQGTEVSKLPSGLIKHYEWNHDSVSAKHTLRGSDISDFLNRDNIVLKHYISTASHIFYASEIVRNIASFMGISDVEWNIEDWIIPEFIAQGENALSLIQSIIEIGVGSWFISDSDALVVYDAFASVSPSIAYVDQLNIFDIGVSEEDTKIVNQVRVSRTDKANMNLLGTCEGDVNFTTTVNTSNSKGTTGGNQPSGGLFGDFSLSFDTVGLGGPSFNNNSGPLAVNDSFLNSDGSAGALSVVSVGLQAVECSFSRPVSSVPNFKIEFLQDCWVRYIFGKTQTGAAITSYHYADPSITNIFVAGGTSDLCLILDNPLKTPPWTSYAGPTPSAVSTPACQPSAANPFTGVKIFFQAITKNDSFGTPIITLAGHYKIRFFGANVDTVIWNPAQTSPVMQLATDSVSIATYGARPATKDIESPLIPNDEFALRLGQRYLLEKGRIAETITKRVPWITRLRPSMVAEVTDSIFGMFSQQFSIETITWELTGTSHRTSLTEIKYVVT